MSSSTVNSKYPKLLDTVIFKSYTVLKKSGKRRRVYECDPHQNVSGYGHYISYRQVIDDKVINTIPKDIRQRTAYNKGVSIPTIIKNLKGGKVFVQVDIKDFFNVCPVTEYQNYIPTNYYYDIINKVGIKQGTNISGAITNLAMLNFDKEMLAINNCYARYADDIIVGCESMEEAQEVLDTITNKIESMGMEINTRKTVITDLTEASDRYIKYLGFTLKRDKLDENKIRVTISRKKRMKWWAKNQKKHTDYVLGGEECFSL